MNCLRAFEIRLLDELGDALNGTERLAAADVAVARFRRARHDAEGDELPSSADAAAVTVAVWNAVDVANDVIGGQHEQHRIFALRGALFSAASAAERNRRRACCARRARSTMARGVIADLTELLRHQEAMGVVADDDGRRGVQAFEPPGRILQHGVLAHEGQQLLG